METAEDIKSKSMVKAVVNRGSHVIFSIDKRNTDIEDRVRMRSLIDYCFRELDSSMFYVVECNVRIALLAALVRDNDDLEYRNRLHDEVDKVQYALKCLGETDANIDHYREEAKPLILKNRTGITDQLWEMSDPEDILLPSRIDSLSGAEFVEMLESIMDIQSGIDRYVPKVKLNRQYFDSRKVGDKVLSYLERICPELKSNHAPVY